jgi:hypothetical protein
MGESASKPAVAGPLDWALLSALAATHAEPLRLGLLQVAAYQSAP